MRKRRQTMHLEDDVDEVLEKVKADTGKTKQRIGNEFIRTEARRRGILKAQEPVGQK